MTYQFTESAAVDGVTGMSAARWNNHRLALQTMADSICRSATFVVAASDTADAGKAVADYVCDGTGDEVEINNAINALPAAGGRVLLLEGTYTIGAGVTPSSKTVIEGQGLGTILKAKDNLAVDTAIINNKDCDTTGNDKIQIKNLAIDGNKANNTQGVYGIYLAKCNDAIVENVVVHDTNYHGIIVLSDCDKIVVSKCIVHTLAPAAGLSTVGIRIGTSTRCIVSNNVIYDCNDDGIYLGGSTHCVISGNTCNSNGENGIKLNGADYCSVSSNVCEGNTISGIKLDSSVNYNTITGNIISSNQQYGIHISASSHNIVNNNMLVANGQETDNTYSNIILDGDSDYNNVQGNTCRRGAGAAKSKYGICIFASTCNANLVTCNDLYDSGSTGTLSDAGTSTNTTAANRLA